MKRLDNVPTHLSRTFTGTYRLMDVWWSSTMRKRLS